MTGICGRCSVPFRHQKVSGDHMKIIFAPGWSRVNDMLALPLGIGVQLVISGVISDENVQVRATTALHMRKGAARPVPQESAWLERGLTHH